MAKTNADTVRKEQKSQFEQEAEAPQMGLLAEFWYFLLHNKKWWITPIVVVLVTFGFLIMFGGSAAAPFIYTLF